MKLQKPSIHFLLRSSSKPLLAALLGGLLTLSASGGNIVNSFTGGFGSDPFPLDEFPGFTGEDPTGGWSTEWRITRSGVQTQIDATNVISTSPLNGGGNYLHWDSYGPASVSGAASLGREFRNSNGVSMAFPYSIEWDYRLDMHVRATGVPDFTQFNNSSDQIQFGAASSFVNGDPNGSFWIKCQGVTANSASVGLINKTWGFFDASTTSSAENNSNGSLFVNSTNAYVLTNKVYHFKIVLDPANRLWDGYVTNVTDSPTVGFSTFDYTGRHFHWRQFSSTSASMISNQNFLFFVSRHKTAGSTNVQSMDNLVISQLPADLFPVTLVQVQPVKAQTFYPYQSNIVFTATTYGTNYLPAANIHMTLNGADVSSSLTLTGTDADQARTVTYSALQDNTVYSGGISVADQTGRMTTNSFFFDTFDTNIVAILEAENYNFDNTQPSCRTDLQGDNSESDRYIQSWQYGGLTSDLTTLINPSTCYLMRPAVDGIDYHLPDMAATPSLVYRACDSNQVNNATTDDYRRQFLLDELLNEYWLYNVGTNAWWNYTHEWPNTNYLVYLRAGAFKFTFTFGLDQVTTDYTQPSQTTFPLGIFTVPPLARSQILHNFPMTDASGNILLLPVNGKETLRLKVTGGDATTNNNSQVNYLVFVPPAVDNGPIRILNPGRSGTNITFNFNSVANAYYVVQYKNTLTDVSWLTLKTVLGTGSSVLVQDSTGGAGRIYRIRSP
jgi:hypothetical protein